MFESLVVRSLFIMACLSGVEAVTSPSIPPLARPEMGLQFTEVFKVHATSSFRQLLFVMDRPTYNLPILEHLDVCGFLNTRVTVAQSIMTIAHTYRACFAAQTTLNRRVDVYNARRQLIINSTEIINKTLNN